MSYVKPKPYNCESFLPKRDARIVTDKSAGLTNSQIAEKYGIQRTRVSTILRRALQKEEK